MVWLAYGCLFSCAYNGFYPMNSNCSSYSRGEKESFANKFICIFHAILSDIHMKLKNLQIIHLYWQNIYEIIGFFFNSVNFSALIYFICRIFKLFEIFTWEQVNILVNIFILYMYVVGKFTKYLQYLNLFISPRLNCYDAKSITFSEIPSYSSLAPVIRHSLTI